MRCQSFVLAIFALWIFGVASTAIAAGTHGRTDRSCTGKCASQMEACFKPCGNTPDRCASKCMSQFETCQRACEEAKKR